MKRLIFFLEMAAFLSVVPILVLAKISYSKEMATQTKPEVSGEKSVPVKESGHNELYESVFPGLINSKFVLVNY